EQVLDKDGNLISDTSNLREWFPIGYHYDRNQDGVAESNHYNGTFDGQNHTISGLYFDNAEQYYVGLFGQTSYGAEICNVTVADSCFKGKNYVGGVCGCNYKGTITNCTNSGSVKGAKYVGGVCGCNSSGTITNSTNSGSVTGTHYVGGVCGDNYYGTITNSTNSGSVEGTRYVGGVCGYNSYGTITNSTNNENVYGTDYAGGVCGRNYNGTITNCYYDSTVFTGDAVGYEDGTNIDVLGKTTAEFQSGEVAYLLQSAQTETDEEGNILHVWGQTIGEDTYPVLGGDKVYKCTSECGGTFYSNTEGDVQAHIYVNGFCTNADCEDPYQPATDTDENGVYEIANAGQLYWFMKLVNSVELEGAEIGYADYDAILTDDITVNKNVLNADGTLNGDGSNFREWFPIGYYYDLDGDGTKEDICYNGTFDGQGHTISGLYFDNTGQSDVGLFGKIYTDAEICNVTVADSYFNAQGWVGSICGSNGGTIRNCTNSGTIRNCTNIDSVEGTDYVGGVCGCNSGMIINSTNNGTVSGSYEVGGVCGINDGTITNCTNSGSVAGEYSIGGVCGYNDSGTITNSTNSGSVNGSDYVGGVCGCNSYGTITNCYYDSDVFTGNAVGDDYGTSTDVLGKTTEEFQSGEVAYLLRQGCTVNETIYSGEIWGQTIGEDTYPVLNGEKVIMCSGNFVNAHPDNCTCNYRTLTAEDFTFTTPEELFYDGSSKEAEVNPIESLTGIGLITVSYYDANGTLMTGPPSDTGTYTVRINVTEGGGYAPAEGITDESWTFAIIKRTLTESDLYVVNGLHQNFNENAPMPTVLLRDSAADASEPVVTILDADGNSVDQITKTGEYTIKAEIAENEYYNAAAFTWTLHIYSVPAEQAEITLPELEIGDTLPETLEVDGHCTAAVTWTPADSTVDYNTGYSVEITLTADENYQFTDETEIISNFELDKTECSDTTIRLTMTYDVTRKMQINSIAPPLDMNLEEHQPDKDAVIAVLPKELDVTTEEGTAFLPLTWELLDSEYDITANAEHIFAWSADCGDLDANGTELTGKIIVTNPDYTDISDQIKLTAEDIIYGNVPKLSANYGDIMLEVLCSKDGVEFAEPDAFLNNAGVLPVGVYTVRANYETSTEKGAATAEFEVVKAKPIVNPFFESTELLEGDPLPEIMLGEGSTAGLIAWTDGVTQLTAGLNELHWKYTPDDAENYEEVSGVETLYAESTTT
ncbi:MAG: hypothetical protein IJ265_13625, partial [Oscillospiraceae bacterium]|nr:hypothetical protein [Oscillospiraceae bacterium]